MPVYSSKSYLAYLNKLVDKYNNTYHCSISKKTIGADYSSLTEKLNQVIKVRLSPSKKFHVFYFMLKALLVLKIFKF